MLSGTTRQSALLGAASRSRAQRLIHRAGIHELAWVKEGVIPRRARYLTGEERRRRARADSAPPHATGRIITATGGKWAPTAHARHQADFLKNHLR